MDSRKLLGFAIGVLLFLATLLFGTFAFYSWKSGNTDVTFNIGDSYFYCETGQNVSETGLAPVLDYQSTTSKYTFKVNNIGKSDTKFSVTLNISEISESLKSTSLKYKLMVDKTGSSSTCDTSSNCTEAASGDFSKMKKGINTIAPSIDLPNNSRYQYYLFIYIDGNMQNDTSMQSGTLKMAIEVCDIIVTLDYNGGNVVDNKEYIKVASLYTGLPDSVSRNTSNVTYDTAGGSSVSNDSVSYTFAGWYLENTFKNKVTASTEVKSTINHTLYAKWNPSKTVTLPTTTKTGYTFAGWYNGSSYVGAAGGSYNPSTSVTLTAHWNANKYTVTLDNQGATTAGTTSVSATYGNAMPSISVPSKSYKVTYNYNGNGQSNTSVNFNYSFGGYYTSTNGGGTQYYKTDGTSYRNYNISSNSTLYAKWTSSPITLPNPTRTGYTFNGWYDESGTKIADGGASYTPKANITLVAHWSVNVYKVTLDNQSATVAGTKEVYYQYNTSKTVNGVICYYYTDSSLSSCLTSGTTITNPSKTGYTFGGYYTSTNGGGTNYINTSGTFINNLYQTAGNRTLYAKWTLSQFQVTYDYATNGGTSATKTSAMMDYGASIDLSPIATKSGWTFVGWNTNKDATSKLSSLTMGTSQVTLYAIYKKTGQVTFNLNGNASFTYNNTKYTSTTAIDLCTMYNRATTCTASVTMPTITASSNTPTIIGWSNASGTHTASYTSGQTNVTLTSGTTWYAQTQKASVQGKVTFNPNGNTAFTYGGTQYTSTTSINLCAIGATYNGTSQATTCTASVTMPTITASSNTPTIIGWSNASGTHTASYTSGQTNVTLTSGTTWYAQTQKAAVQGKVTFNPNGNAAFTYGGTKYTSTTSINLCTIGATYNGTSQASTCTASVTMPTITALSNTPTIIGWSNASGTHSASYTSGQTNVTLTSGTTWYAQTQKVAVTLSASFNANGATLSSTTSQSCTLGVVYNGASQATSCTVSAPTITRSGYTVVGFNTSASSISNHSAYSTSTGKITLTTSLNGVTWYAVTYQSISASFNYYNSGIKSTSANCNRYNTSTSCTVTVPLSTFNTTKSQYGGSYVGYGAVNTVGTNTSSTTSISGNTTYYVSYRGNVTEYYQNTSRTIYRNSYFTSTSAMSTVLSTSNTGTSSYSPSSYTKDSVTWSWYGYATSSSTGTRTYSSVSVAAPTTTTTLYTLYSRNVIATFYYSGGSGIATTNGSGTQIANYTGSVVSNGSISIPGTVSSSKGPNSSTYSGVSTSKSSTTTTTPTTANTTYYAVYLGKWTATYTKGSNVSSIGSTSNSCNNYYTTNTSSYSGSNCSVTLPTITVGSDYVALGWYNSSSNLIGQPGGQVTLSSNQTFTAKARNLKADELYYDNSNTGEDCDTAQCMIDKIDELLQ